MAHRLLRPPPAGYDSQVSVDVETSIEIAVPRDVVARYAADPDHACDWYMNIKSVEWKTPPPMVEGSQVAFVARFLGRRMAYTYCVRQHVEGQLLVMSTADGPFPM